MTLKSVLAFGALLVAACNAPLSEASPTAAAPDFTPVGSWRIVSVDGVAARSAFPESPPPSVSFSEGGYGGSSGCNSFGAVGFWQDGRWYGDIAMMTAIGCSDLREQEDAITQVLISAPTILEQADGRAEVVSADHRLVLERIAGDPAPTPPPRLLAGSRWSISAADATLVHDGGRSFLAFAADNWTLTTACGVTSGSWSQDERRLNIRAGDLTGACAGDPIQAAFHALAEAEVGFASGPNGEFVLGGSGHWLRGGRERSDPDAALRRLAGEWRPSSLNGQALSVTDRPPSVRFSGAAYSVWDGCNQTEGLALVWDDQLFIAPSGLSTLAACEPDAAGRAARSIVGGDPRIAWESDSELALVTRGGELRLRRVSSAPAAAAPTRLAPGMRFDLLEVGGQLDLASPRAFTVTLDCARFTGEWRSGAQLRFTSNPPDVTRPNCDTGPGSDAFRASQVFNGDVRAVVDPNGRTMLVVGDAGALRGRAAP